MVNQNRLQTIVLFFALLFVLAACTTTPSPAIQSTLILDTDTPSPTLTETPIREPSTAIPDNHHLESATPNPALWAQEYIPEELITYIADLYQMDITSDQQLATLIIDLDGKHPDAKWIYALSAPFPTNYDGVTDVDLRDVWLGNSEAGPFTGIPLRMDQETYVIFSTIWGTPPPEVVQVTPRDELLHTAWENQPSWAIIPFGQA